jgi:cell wall-associated NlpC family hydrolase
MHSSIHARPEPVALALLAPTLLSSAGCATSGAVPRPFPGATVVTGGRTPAGAATGTPDAPETPASASGEPDAIERREKPDLLARRFDGRAIAQFAMGFRGVPYRPGGADPGGFDCSGLVQYVFAQYGVAVPRVVEQQFEIGDRVKPANIEPGDLIFFNTARRGRGASHVGIAISLDRFVHAPNSTGVVRVESLGSGYWGPRYLGARRVASPGSVRLDTPVP